MPDARHREPPRYLFVYGTLRRGGSNDITLWQPAPRYLGLASVQGTLYDFGAYPGLCLSGHDRVAGEVYEIDPALEIALDRLEGVRDDGSGEYLKRMADVAARERTLRCLVYEIHSNQLANAATVISGADWLAHTGAG